MSFVEKSFFRHYCWIHNFQLDKFIPTRSQACQLYNGKKGIDMDWLTIQRRIYIHVVDQINHQNGKIAVLQIVSLIYSIKWV